MFEISYGVPCVNAFIKGMLEDLHSLLFGNHPFVGAAKRHGAKNDLGNLETGLSKPIHGSEISAKMFKCTIGMSLLVVSHGVFARLVTEKLSQVHFSM